MARASAHRATRGVARAEVVRKGVSAERLHEFGAVCFTRRANGDVRPAHDRPACCAVEMARMRAGNGIHFDLQPARCRDHAAISQAVER